MSESTLEAPTATVSPPATEHRGPAPAPVPWTIRAFARQHPGWSTAIGLVIFSTILVLYARTRPSYDAYGWLGWGYTAIHGSLNLGGAPSWKPMPFLFTVPYAVFGHYAVWLWMITAVSISLAGCIFAGRIAYRIVGDRPEHRWAALAAATFAGLAVLGIEDYMHYILSAQTDPMLVTFTLAAIDCHLSGRPRWAFVLGWLTSLGRPEAWPFLGLYSIWAWRSVPRMRWMLYAGWPLIAFLWFGIPTITNHRPLVAGDLATGSPRQLRQNKITGTIGRFTELQYLPIWLAALFTVVVAILRRNRLVLALAGGVVLWEVVEIVFAYHGWPAIPRYVFESAAVATVLAGVGFGWLLIGAPALWRGAPRWAAAGVAVVLVGSLVPAALARLRTERADLHHERARTHQIALLQSVTDSVGGSHHVVDCGQPVTDVAYVSSLAWLYHIPVGFVGGFQQHVEAASLADPAVPKVLIKPASQGGWNMEPWHTRPSQVARCAGLHVTYTSSGALIHR